MAKMVGVRVTNTAAQAIATATATVLTFDTEAYDDDTMHSTGSNTGRITFTTAGRYHVGAVATFDTHATGFRIYSIRLNGTTTITKDRRPGSSTGALSASISVDYNFAANDYVEVVVYQDSGGNLDILNTGSDITGFWAHRIG